MLVVDDQSPDGTGALARSIASAQERVFVEEREGPRGLGPAYLHGFRWALDRDYRFIFEMDADFSHRPAYLPAFLAAAEHSDLVLGCRYMRGGGVEGGADYNYATSWSFSPKELLTFIIPSALGFGGQTYWGNMPFTDYPNYMGIVILVLAAIGFVHRRDPLMWFLLGTSILAIFISFGKNLNIIYDLFYSFFPYFNKFRVPAMILILVQFNFSVMAALGLNYLLTLHKQVIPRWFWTCTGILVIFLLILTFWQSSIQQLVSSGFTPPRTQDPRTIQAINALRWDMWLKDAWIMVLILAAFFGLVWAFINQKIAKNGFTFAVTLLALTDIGIVDRKIIQPDKQSGRASQLMSRSIIDRYFQHDQITKLLTDDSDKPFRVYPAGALFSESRILAFGIESVGGYHPAKLKIYNDFLQRTNNV